MKFEGMINTIQLANSYKLIKQIPDKSIDCIYIDIPYLYSGGYHKHQNKCNVGVSEKFVDSLKDIINGIDYSIYDQFIRISKVGNIFIWLSKEQIKYTLNYFTSKGFLWELLTWHKTNPQPLAHNSYLSDTEYCLHFRKKGINLNDGFELKSKYYVSSLNQYDKKHFIHPTIKPLELVKKHLLHATQENDIVLDCFCGSGTTCVAAKEIGRNYIGIEINPKYFKIASDRLKGITANGQTTIFTDFDELEKDSDN